MAIIQGYTFRQRAVKEYKQIFDADTGKFAALKADDIKFQDLHELLDSITLAVEAGLVDDQTWVKQIFGKLAVFEKFLEVLGDYDGGLRLTDRWWQALAALCNHEEDEDDFVSGEEIAGALQQYATDTKQIK